MLSLAAAALLTLIATVGYALSCLFAPTRPCRACAGQGTVLHGLCLLCSGDGVRVRWGVRLTHTFRAPPD